MMNRLKKTQKTWNSFMIMFILICNTTLVKTAPLTMGFGKNLNLRQNDAYSEQAFDLDIFSNQKQLQEMFPNKQLPNLQRKNFHHAGKENCIEVDVKHSKNKEIQEVLHMFCSGYYCAFQYSTDPS